MCERNLANIANIVDARRRVLAKKSGENRSFLCIKLVNSWDASKRKEGVFLWGVLKYHEIFETPHSNTP